MKLSCSDNSSTNAKRFLERKFMTTSEIKLLKKITRSTRSGTTSEECGRAKNEKLLYIMVHTILC